MELHVDCAAGQASSIAQVAVPAETALAMPPNRGGAVQLPVVLASTHVDGTAAHSPEAATLRTR